MNMSANLELIEPRIAELVQQYVGSRFSNDSHSVVERMALPLEQTMVAVVNQAVTSSEGGKRLRALLTMETFEVLQSSDRHANCTSQEQRQADTDEQSAARDSVLDIACAIEVFQTAALVHDDIIDASDLRRGKPSAHRALSTLYGDDALGEGLGIMLGDLLATACISIVNLATTALPNGTHILDVFLRMQHEVEIGQVLDLSIETMDLDDPEALVQASLDVFRWKTASYTTIAPLELAFLAAGMEPVLARQHAFAIGRPLGVAFQLADDLLDVTGQSASTGKPVGGDIREGKRNVLLADALFALDQRTDDPDAAQTASHLRELFIADHRNDDDVAWVIATFQRTGAITHSKSRIQSLWRQSCAAIEDLDLDSKEAATITAICARFLPNETIDPSSATEQTR